MIVRRKGGSYGYGGAGVGLTDNEHYNQPGRNTEYWVVRILPPLLGLALVYAVGFWFCRRRRRKRDKRSSSSGGGGRGYLSVPAFLGPRSSRHAPAENNYADDASPDASPPRSSRPSEGPRDSTAAHPLNEPPPVYSRDAKPAINRDPNPSSMLNV